VWYVLRLPLAQSRIIPLEKHRTDIASALDYPKQYQRAVADMKFEFEGGHLGDAFKIPRITIREEVEEGQAVELMRS